MTDWVMVVLTSIDLVCIVALFLHCLKLRDESNLERMRIRRAMDYALCIDDILTGATMSEDKRKELQTCYHYYLAAIGHCSMNMSIDWDLVAKRRDAMDEALAQSGWEWRVDDRP